MSYQFQIADWAFDERNCHDVISIEHVRDDGGLCLIFSTTLAFTLDAVNDAVARHESICDK